MGLLYKKLLVLGAAQSSVSPCHYEECPVGYTCLEGVTVKQVLDNAVAVIT